MFNPFDDQMTKLAFSIYENPGVYALLAGSGLSRAAGIPTGWEITLDLIRRFASNQGVEPQTDWADWFRKHTGKEPNYSQVLDVLDLTSLERRTILNQYIEPTSREFREHQKAPVDSHFAIADLVKSGYIRVIITTNFDRLLERALQYRGVSPVVVSSVDALEGAEPLRHSKCFLLKLHGDYKDSRILNTESELSDYLQEFDDLLDQIFDEYGLIVSGWSSEWDHALRKAILRSPARRYSLFWTARRKPSDKAIKLIKHRRGHLISIPSAEEFFPELRDRVKANADTQQSNPQSTTHLVARVKRYVVNSESQIKLDELLTAELNTMLGKFEQASWPPSNELDLYDRFPTIVQICEACVEPLAKIVGVLGRWGTNSEFTTVLHIIRSTIVRADTSTSNMFQLAEFKTYPAVLFVAAYGIGLVRSQRWDTLYRLLSESLEINGGIESRVVDSLFPNTRRGIDGRFWKSLEGLDNSRAPLNDYLCKLFTRWSKSFVGIVPEFEELYETWEILAAICHLEVYTEEQNIDNQSSDPSPPIVRSVRDTDRWRRIYRTITKSDVRKALLSANFANGDEDNFEIIINLIVVVILND